MSAVQTAAATSIQLWWERCSRRVSARDAQHRSVAKEAGDYISAGDIMLRRANRPMWGTSGFPGTAERLHGHLMVHMRQVLDMVAVQAACRAVSSTSHVVGTHSVVARNTVSGAETEARDAIHVSERFGFQLINAKWLACHVVTSSMTSATVRREQELTTLLAAGSTYAAEYWALGCAALLDTDVQHAHTQLLVLAAESDSRTEVEGHGFSSFASVADLFQTEGLRIVAAEFIENTFRNAGRNLTLKTLELEEAATRAAIDDNSDAEHIALLNSFTTSKLHLWSTVISRGLLYVSSLTAWLSKMQLSLAAQQERGMHQLQAEEAEGRDTVSRLFLNDEEACLRLRAAQFERDGRLNLEMEWPQCEEAATRCAALSHEHEERVALESEFHDVIAEARARWSTARLVVNEALDTVIGFIEARDAIAFNEVKPRTELENDEERRRADITVEWHACRRHSVLRTSAALTIANASRQFLSKRTLRARSHSLRTASDVRVFAECLDDWTTEKHGSNHSWCNEHHLFVACAHGQLTLFSEGLATREAVIVQHHRELDALERREEEVRDLVAAIVSGVVELSDRSSALEFEASQAWDEIVAGEVAEFDSIRGQCAAQQYALFASAAATTVQQGARRWLAGSRVRSMACLVDRALMMNDEAANREALYMEHVEEDASLQKQWIWHADLRALGQILVHFKEGAEIVTLNGAARTLQRIARGVHARARVGATQRRLQIQLVGQDEICERDEVANDEEMSRRNLEHLDSDSLLQADQGSARRSIWFAEQQHRMWIASARLEAIEESNRFYLQRGTLAQMAALGNRVCAELSYILQLQAAARSQTSRLAALRKQDEQRTLDPSTSPVFSDENQSRLGISVAEAEARLSLHSPWLAFSVTSGQVRPASVVADMDEMRCAARSAAGDLETRLAYARSTQRQRCAFHLLDVGYRRYVSRTDVVTAVDSAHSADIAVGVDFVDFVDVATQVNPEQFAFATQRTHDRLPPAARGPYARFASNAQDAARELAVSLVHDRLKDLGDEIVSVCDPAAMSIVCLWLSIISPCSAQHLAPEMLALQCATAAGRSQLIRATLRATWMDVSEEHVEAIQRLRQAALRNCDLRRETTMLLQDVKRWAIGLGDINRLNTPQYAATTLSVPDRSTPSLSRPSTAPRPASPASPSWQEVPSPMVVHKPVPPTATAPAVHRRLAW